MGGIVWTGSVDGWCGRVVCVCGVGSVCGAGVGGVWVWMVGGVGGVCVVRVV